MKKQLLFFLLLAGTATGLLAQTNPYNPYESMFDSPKPGKGNGFFSFYYSGRQSVLIEFDYISQLNYLPNLDSLLQHTIQMLEPLKDSLKADGMVRRVDVAYRGEASAIRIVPHPEYSNAYTVKDNELMQLKVNQDTLRMVVFTQTSAKTQPGAVTSMYPFVVTLLVNDLGDIANVPHDRLSQCVATLRPKVERYINSGYKNSPDITYRAQFNMMTGKMFSPFSARYISSAENGFNPVIGFGLVATRGAVAPTLEGGVEYAKSNAYFTNRFRLSFELQTFFSRDSAQKLRTFNNSFIDIGYRQTGKPFNDNKLHFVPNLSIGYLYRHQGEWYERNTFRLGLPQLAGKHLSLTPYLVFNDFFKNVSIGFRFCFNF